MNRSVCMSHEEKTIAALEIITNRRTRRESRRFMSTTYLLNKGSNNKRNPFFFLFPGYWSIHSSSSSSSVSDSRRAISREEFSTKHRPCDRDVELKKWNVYSQTCRALDEYRWARSESQGQERQRRSLRAHVNSNRVHARVNLTQQDAHVRLSISKMSRM